jgi:Ca2+-binding EF-hand superfamily protein
VSTCRALWESFPPVACDVHCPSSALRDVFLKLLHRRGVNYRQAFIDHCERKYKRAITRRDNGDDDDNDPVPDDLTEQQQMERYASMTRREFTRFLGDQGIIVQPEEAQRLVEYFNDEEEGVGDGLEEHVSMSKFLAVVGDERLIQCHGDTDMLLRQVCMWETVCHECGMLRAFQLVVSNTSSTSGGGGSRLRAELPGHIKRREQGGGRFVCTPECDLRVVKKLAPAPCPFSQWSDELALPFLKKLELWSAAPREQRVLQQLVTNGQPPDAPPLYRVDEDVEINDNNDSEAAVDATTMLLLRWAPPRVTGNNGAAFYQLETAGAEGSSSFRKNEFREICRDPRDFSDNGGKPRYQFLVTGLTPNTKYAFRVRALNGFGAGSYNFAYFVTAPASPPAPVAVKVSASSISLAWDTSRSYQRHLRELRRVFDAADADGDGVISRDEFMDQLERRQPRLLEFLQRVTIANGSKTDGNGPPLSVFDVIETDDSENLSWSEFLGFFHGALSVDDADDADNNSGDDDTGAGGKLSRASSRVQLLGASTSSRAGGMSLRKRVESPLTVGTSRFILKQCTNEANGEYVEIYRGATPSFVVHGLPSGSTFQFRVQAENEEGRCSLHSPPVIVNTLLPTPPPPTESGASSSAVKLKWSAATARPSVAYEALQQRNGGSGVTVKRQNGGSVSGGAAAPKQSDDISRLLKEWAQETSFDDGSVDFRARFDRLDADKSGYIELPEFRALLAELGVAPSDERLAAYLAEFDTDADGRISFSEFARWWNRTDDVQYVLKRDRGQPGDQELGVVSSSSSSSSEMAVVSYRGKDTSAVVAGLEPNTLYRFRLRVVSAHASSQLSDALELWTVPAAPTCPGRISVSCTSALLRWHAGALGAYRFVLECRLVETLPSTGGGDIQTGAGRSAAVNSGGWTRVYEGSEPVAAVSELLPSTVYRVRVVALNRVGGMSEQSTVTQICTPSSREEERAGGGGPLRASNAAEHFTVECAEVGDLVRGDAVLFCERLYRSNGVDSRAGQPGKSLATSSVHSVSSAAGGMVAIGERTVAARVVGAKTDDKHGRVLSMVVLWSTAQLYDDPTGAGGDKRVSTRSTYTGTSKRSVPTGSVRDARASGSSLLAAGHALATDLKISRREKSLYRFDTFRKQWVDERARLASSWDQ